MGFDLKIENDWVKARIDCSVAHVWAILVERLRADYLRWGVMTEEAHERVQFDNGAGSVVVTKTLKGGRSITLTVRPAGDGIEFLTARPGIETSSPVRFTPYAASDANCCLFREGKEHPIWEVSRDFLGPVLFAMI